MACLQEYAAAAGAALIRTILDGQAGNDNSRAGGVDIERAVGPAAINSDQRGIRPLDGGGDKDSRELLQRGAEGDRA